MNWLALDIGGANIKAADGGGYAAVHGFALWKRPQRLAQELRRVIADGPPCDHLVATMTGELADCYETKSDGVRAILAAMREAADGRHTRIYLNDGRMVTPQVADRIPQLAAASNWHALARFVGRYAKAESGLLIDIGSTTVDMIPLANGAPATSGSTDTERLRSGELFYSGVERSPLCAVLDRAPYRDAELPVAQELFATMRDVYLIMGDLREESTSTDTADGRPATKRYARSRLARVICSDNRMFNHRDAIVLAKAAGNAQLEQLARQARRVLDVLPNPPSTVVVSGNGEFLAVRLVKRLQLSSQVVSLRAELGPTISVCGPAHALAVLARELTEHRP